MGESKLHDSGVGSPSTSLRSRRRALSPATVRVKLIRPRRAPSEERLRGPGDVWRLLGPPARAWDREHFLTLILDGKSRVPLGVNEVFVGSLTATLVHPREVLKSIILANGASFISVHNYPSGDPTPIVQGPRRHETDQERRRADRNPAHRPRHPGRRPLPLDGQWARAVGVARVDHTEQPTGRRPVGAGASPRDRRPNGPGGVLSSTLGLHRGRRNRQVSLPGGARSCTPAAVPPRIGMSPGGSALSAIGTTAVAESIVVTGHV